jgi:regulator of RNase E activity RraA
VPIECGGVLVNPGDIIFGDSDGIVVIPSGIAGEVIEKCLEKVNSENIVRDEILAGASATGVYKKYHIL